MYDLSQATISLLESFICFFRHVLCVGTRSPIPRCVMPDTVRRSELVVKRLGVVLLPENFRHVYVILCRLESVKRIQFHKGAPQILS